MLSLLFCFLACTIFRPAASAEPDAGLTVPMGSTFTPRVYRALYQAVAERAIAVLERLARARKSAGIRRARSVSNLRVDCCGIRLCGSAACGRRPVCSIVKRWLRHIVLTSGLANMRPFAQRAHETDTAHSQCVRCSMRHGRQRARRPCSSRVVHAATPTAQPAACAAISSMRSCQPGVAARRPMHAARVLRAWYMLTLMHIH